MNRLACLLASFALLGLFPLAARKIVEAIQIAARRMREDAAAKPSACTCARAA